MGKPFMKALLRKRAARGKEDTERLKERQGYPSAARPPSPLIWLHAASVGEALSSLILIETVIARYPVCRFLVTTGTVTSAQLMEKRLPPGVIHQYYPLDHPTWVARFLDYWSPDLILWMESELWPNMLARIRETGITAVLVNARLSKRTYSRWKWLPAAAREMLETFSLCLAQTPQDADHLRRLGAPRVIMSGNIKYSAAPLPIDEKSLAALSAAIGNRPCWVYASTHKGEETLACRIHRALEDDIPGLLTIIVPRHPDRRRDIAQDLEAMNVDATFRFPAQEGASPRLPDESCGIYVADTLGELGLFYHVSKVACIGRTFSLDGGGGHNLIEAAQERCAILHGPNVQNLADLFEDFDTKDGAILVSSEGELKNRLRELLKNPVLLDEYQQQAKDCAEEEAEILEIVMAKLAPLLSRLKALPAEDSRAS